MAIKILWIIFNGGFEFFANIYRARPIARYQKVRPADVGLELALSRPFLPSTWVINTAFSGSTTAANVCGPAVELIRTFSIHRIAICACCVATSAFRGES